jgi:hypothetical protein
VKLSSSCKKKKAATYIKETIHPNTTTLGYQLALGNKNKLAEAHGILGDHFQLESVNIDRKKQPFEA